MSPVQAGIHMSWLSRWLAALIGKSCLSGIWSHWADSLELSELMNSHSKAAWPWIHACSFYTYTHVHSHQHFLNRQLTGGQIVLITQLIITAPSDTKQPGWRVACWSTTFTYVSRRKDKTTKCKDSKMQCADSLTLDSSCRWEGRSRGDLTEASESRQLGLSLGSLLMQRVPAI